MWTPGIKGAGEARLYALEAIIKEAIPDLNRAVQLNPTLAYLISKTPQLGPLNPNKCVDIGDLEVMPDLKNGWLQIRLEAGGHQNGMDVSAQRRHISGASVDIFYTLVALYLHPEAFRNEQKQLLQRQRCIAQELCSDWMRARVLNYINQPDDVDRRQIQLTSQERYTAGGSEFDMLSECLAVSGSKGVYQRQFGTEFLYGITFTHQGTLYD